MNGANYQHSGTEPLRSPTSDPTAPIQSASPSGTNRVAAAYQKTGTENFRSQNKRLTATYGPSGNGTAKFTPPNVDSFTPDCV